MTIFIDGYLWRIFSASVSPSMYGIRISVRTTSGSKASIFSNASSPFSASPTTVNPTACQSILRIILLRTSSSSSTRIILYKSISCSYLLKDLFQMLPDDRLIGQFCDMTVHARLDRSFSETAVSPF